MHRDCLTCCRASFHSYSHIDTSDSGQVADLQCAFRNRLSQTVCAYTKMRCLSQRNRDKDDSPKFLLVDKLIAAYRHPKTKYVKKKCLCCFLHVLRYFPSEMSSERHLNGVQFYPKQMNVNMSTLYYVDCCTIHNVW